MGGESIEVYLDGEKIEMWELVDESEGWVLYHEPCTDPRVDARVKRYGNVEVVSNA